MGKVKIGDFLHRIKRPISLCANQNYKLVTIKMHHKGVTLRSLKKGADIKSKMYQVKEGDFILSGIDARNGAFGIVPKELDGAIVTNDFWYFELDTEVIDKHFFLELTSTSWFDEMCRLGSDGTTQRIRLQKDKFFNQEIILPPLDEQRDFITKFIRSKTINSNIENEIETQQELLKKLRQSILQEAIEGKLTVSWREQNPDVESVSILLEKIQAEKERLIKEKKIKKQKSLPPINEDEIPFDIPDSWEWCRLGQLGYAFRGKSPKYDARSQTLAINQKCVRWGFVDMEFGKGIKTDWYESIDTFLLTQNNDLLVNSTGEGTIGRSALINNLSQNLIYDSHVLLLRLLFSESKYVMNIINSNFGQQQIDNSKGAKSTKQTELGVEKLQALIIPIPPLYEQQQIVKKIESLFSYCDELEVQINSSKTNSQTLMQAVLKEAFEG